MKDSPAVILYDGYGNPIRIINGGIVVNNTSPQVKVEYDLSSASVNYIGTALAGTDVSTAGWTIKKITFDVSGNPVEITWTGTTAIWNNRSSEVYI